MSNNTIEVDNSTLAQFARNMDLLLGDPSVEIGEMSVTINFRKRMVRRKANGRRKNPNQLELPAQGGQPEKSAAKENTGKSVSKAPTGKGQSGQRRGGRVSTAARKQRSTKRTPTKAALETLKFHDLIERSNRPVSASEIRKLVSGPRGEKMAFSTVISRLEMNESAGALVRVDNTLEAQKAHYKVHTPKLKDKGVKRDGFIPYIGDNRSDYLWDITDTAMNCANLVYADEVRRRQEGKKKRSTKKKS